MIAFSNIFNLLNMIRCIASGYSVMLHGDVTSKASSSAFNKLSFGVNMLGGHCMPWATALIPAETESEHAYTEVYKAAHSATKRILTLPSCGRQEKVLKVPARVCNTPCARMQYSCICHSCQQWDIQEALQIARSV